jgi:pyrroloquinoline quinone (PQQ) biosynthesis protein C
MIQPSSSFSNSLDKIVASCQVNLKWAVYSKDHLAVSGARTLVQQWGIFTRHSRRCWAYVVGNCPHIEVRKFIVTENLYEEEALEGHSHFELLVKMGNAVGLGREQIESAKPLPTTVVALHAWETLTKNRSWYKGLAAKAVLERTNDRNCGNFSALEAERWMRQLKLSAEDVEFWVLHDSVDQVHGGGSFALLEKYLRTDAEKEAALRAAEESMMAWKVYLDGICDASAGSNPSMELRYGTA